MLTIEARALGRKKPLVPEWSVPVPPAAAGGDGALTLRELIAGIVRQEVQAFRGRQEARRFLRVLSPEEIEEGAARGKVDMGGHDLQPEVDEEAAVAAALQAFQDGLYLVILDGEEQKELERPVRLRAESRLTFLRLTLLAGG